MFSLNVRFITLIVAVALILIAGGSTSAEIPKKINYQGKLTDIDSGDPLTGSHSMTFRIYDDPVLGSHLWSETQTVSADSAGIFSAILGSVTLVDISFEGPVWLEVEVDTEVLSPRRELVSVPFAFRAQEAEHAAGADSLGGMGSDSYSLSGHSHTEYVTRDEVGSITGDMITDGEITDDDIAGGAGIDPGKIAGTAWTSDNDGSGGGLDADMIDGLHADAFADTTHSHNELYFTKEELLTAGTLNNPGNPVHWTKLTGVPDGFADGVDDAGLGDGHSLDAADGDPLDQVYVDNDGNVGIGTTNPQRRLHIVGENPRVLIEASSLSPEVNFVSSGDPASDIWAIYKDYVTDDLRFFQWGDKVTIQDSTGNVGIGTADPIVKLDVQGDIDADSLYRIGGETVLSASGPGNIRVGVYAGKINGGKWTTLVGDSAGYLNWGHSNTFVGYLSGFTNSSGGSNTFVGKEAGYSNRLAGMNTFIGQGAGHENEYGDGNTFVGKSAGYSNKGGYNTFVGLYAGLGNDTGGENTFMGHSAGSHNISGIENTYIGRNAGALNETGSGNVCIGNKAGFNEMGSDKLYIANGSDDSDVLIYGDFSTGRIGLGTTSPERNLHIVGDNPRIMIEAETINPEVNFKNTGDAVGDMWALYKDGATNDFRFYQSSDKVTIQNATGNVGIGTTDPGAYKLYVQGTAYSTGGWQGSDLRFKKDIEGIDEALDKVLSLRGVLFSWRTDEYEDRGFPEGRHHGVIAQEVQQVLPEAVKEGPEGEKAVAYTEIIPVLIEAIKSQQQQIDHLETKLEVLQAQLTQQK